MAVPRLADPVVLAHGLFRFYNVRLGRLTLSAYFRGIPEYLRAGGNTVFVARVPSLAGIKARAGAFLREIDTAFPDRPVHVIAHSMGGLDARQALADGAGRQRILSLTTIGTPHLGTALADHLRLQAGPLYRTLRTFRVNRRGFFDLTRRAARAVNSGLGSAEGVPCFCVAGNPLASEVCWPLRPFHATLFDLEGPNDGLVSVQSALGFGTPLDPWPLDHFRQVNGLPNHRTAAKQAALQRLYAGLLENLLRHGFAAGQWLPETPSGPPSRFRFFLSK